MYPGVSIDGSHVLMETKGVAPCGSCPTPHHLYMWVDSAGVAYEIAGGQAVNYVGMTSDGSKVFFTTNLPLTADDHDTSVDMYMWSEEGELPASPWFESRRETKAKETVTPAAQGGQRAATWWRSRAKKAPTTRSRPRAAMCISTRRRCSTATKRLSKVVGTSTSTGEGKSNSWQP